MSEESEALREELRFHELIKSANGDQLITLVSTRVDKLTDKYTRRLKDKVTELEIQVADLQEKLTTKSKHLKVSSNHSNEHHEELRRWRDYAFKLGYPQGSYSDELMRKWLTANLEGAHVDETCLQVANPEKRRQKLEKSLSEFAQQVSTPILRLNAIRGFRKALLAPAALRIKDLEESLVAAQTYAPADKLKAEQRIEGLTNELTVELNAHSQSLKAWREWCLGYLTYRECTQEELRERMTDFIEKLVKSREEAECQGPPGLTEEEIEKLLVATDKWKEWEDSKGWTPSMMIDLLQNSMPLLFSILRRVWPSVFEQRKWTDARLAKLAEQALYVDEQDTPTALGTARKALVLIRDVLQKREEEE